ncbi:preprotein translocase subunit YajC [Cnuibacter physcomitrellae]|uniref:preprotein translocase subunit YajC n=1 Tax=Cnuibacter physcomitrellae TaxID=1619308 RepID=UPI002175AEC3|nr:preprotein translocase subunit YajC [Cnuibacter physcomitrellae]MCS5496873.1 preprotein translocase subunit YajC [Cnuibacter physcomitrellae]
MALDPLTIGMLVVLAVLVFFMFRSSRKRQKQQQELQSKVAVGAEVMTNFGVFGTILELDDEENQVLIETTPGTVLKVHRQTVTRVVTPADAETEDAAATPAAPALETSDGAPAYGERIDETAEPVVDTKSEKKADE